MNRTPVAVLLVVVAAAGIVACFLIGNPSAVSPTGRQAEDVSHPGGPIDATEPGGAPVTQEIVTAPYAEADVPEESLAGFEEPVADGRRILVFDKGSGEPVPFAVVYLLDFESLTTVQTASLQPMGDVEQMYLQYGKRYRAGDDGIARIPHVFNGSVFASKGELRGYQPLFMSNDDPLRVALAPGKAVRVRVVNGGGRPVQGVPVVLGPQHVPLLTRTSDEGGLVAFKHLDQVLGSGSIKIKYSVYLGVPSRDGPSEPVDVMDPPADPIRLVLPDTGSVVVTARDATGRLLRSGFARLEIGVVPRRVKAERVMQEGVVALEDGRAVFPFVALELPLIATVLEDPFSEPVSVRAIGPVRPGEEVLIDVTVDTSSYVMVARAVDEDGSLLPKTLFHVEISEGDGPNRDVTAATSRLMSDAEGLLRIRLNPLWAAATTRRVTLTMIVNGVLFGEGRIETTRAFPQGETPVGDVRIERSPLLVSGVVVDAQGDPISWAHVGLERRVLDAEERGDFRWQRVWSRPRTDALGRFEYRGLMDQGDLRVVASARGFLPGAPTGFRAGATGVSLVLQRAGGIQGRLLLDPGVPSPAVTATAMDGEHPTQYAAVQGDGIFNIEELAPGLVRVEVQTQTKDPVATVEGIRVIAGEKTEDPRLTIDLRGSLHVIHVHVRTPDETPDTRIALEIRDAKGRRLRCALTKGLGSVVTDSLPLEVFASNPGCRREIRTGVTEDVEITLRPSIPIHVQILLEGTPPPEPLSICARLTPDVQPAAGFFTDRARQVEAPRSKDSGLAHLLADAPGASTLAIMLVDARSGEAELLSLALGDPTRLHVADTAVPQTFQVRVPAEVLERACAEAKRRRLPR
jgi:hypothetical protein